MVQLLFKIAIERQPSMIFIGEVEGLMKQREGSDTFSVENIKRDILVKMSNVQAKKHLVTVIGASNRPYVLDEAFVRRFTLRLHVPPPDTILKVRLLQTLLDDVTHHLSEDDIRRLADDRVLEGASVAHIIDVIHTLNRDLVGLIAEAEYFDKVNDPASAHIALLTTELDDARGRSRGHRPIQAQANSTIAEGYRPLFLEGFHARGTALVTPQCCRIRRLVQRIRGFPFSYRCCNTPATSTMEQKVWLSSYRLISQNSQVRLLCVCIHLSKVYFQRCDYSIDHVALGFVDIALSFHRVTLSVHRVALIART